MAPPLLAYLGPWPTTSAKRLPFRGPIEVGMSRMANPTNQTQKDIKETKDTNRNRGERPAKSNQDRQGMPGSRKPIDDDYPPMKVAPETEEPEQGEEDVEEEDKGFRAKPTDLGKGTFGGKPYGKKDNPGDSNDRGGFGSGTGKSSDRGSKDSTSGHGQQMAYGDDEDE